MKSSSSSLPLGSEWEGEWNAHGMSVTSQIEKVHQAIIRTQL